MKAWIARRIQPKMCDHMLEIVLSYKAPDQLLSGVIVRGRTEEVWRTCGKRPGHRGEHGPWSNWFRWRTMLANWIYE